VLSIDGEDFRALALVQRNRWLARIMPRVESRLMVLDALRARGTRLYELACERDLQGIVAKWARGTYQCDGRATSWLKIKDSEYSQIQGRHELFAATRAKWRQRGPKTTAYLSRSSRSDIPAAGNENRRTIIDRAWELCAGSRLLTGITSARRVVVGSGCTVFLGVPRAKGSSA
jgi:hypothetical protein